MSLMGMQESKALNCMPTMRRQLSEKICATWWMRVRIAGDDVDNDWIRELKRGAHARTVDEGSYGAGRGYVIWRIEKIASHEDAKGGRTMTRGSCIHPHDLGDSSHIKALAEQAKVGPERGESSKWEAPGV